MHSLPRILWVPFHQSLLIYAAANAIKDELDVDADTSQGHLPFWCICEMCFITASYSIPDEKQADMSLTTAEYIDISLW